jgi:hypothetical protein
MDSDNGKKYNKKTLSLLYTEAVAIDKKIFAEQKSNVLLYAGEHYAKPGSKFWQNIRDTRNLDNSTKIRIVKNHIQKICKSYTNNILNFAPGVTVVPRQEKELQHVKSAQLNESVWQFIKLKQNLDQKTASWAHDFVVQGEVAVRVFWNPKKGRHIGFKQAVDKNGEPLWDEEPIEAREPKIHPETGEILDEGHPGSEGTPKAGQAVFSGDLDYERLFTFNFLRDPASRSIDDSPILGYQKIIPYEELEKQYAGDKDKLSMLQEGISGSDYVVFDANDQRYVETKNQVLLVEWYVRPCDDYPNGYYFMATPDGDVLEEMELPFGIYPIIYEGFDELTSTPRHYSIIKVARPYQSNLNFLASKATEHSVTLGDDKIITPMGAKIQQGSFLPGIRQVQASGDFKIMEGRMGEQFLNQMPAVIQEMYAVCNLAEDAEEKSAQLDAYTLLYRSMREKKRFSKYGQKFERFLKQVCEVSLATFKNYVSDDELIPAIGRCEMVNIEEFRGVDPLHVKIDVVPQTEDMETKLGKQLQIQTILQYTGSSLSKEDIGQLMRNAPYGNKEEMFGDLTMQYDNAVNDILALDRGEYPEARKQDDHAYQIKKLESRMAKADFKMLHPFIKQQYQQKVQEHEMIMSQAAQQIQMAESGFIPTSGPLGSADLYVTDPSSPQKVQRAKFPISSLEWLAEKLAQQGAFMGDVQKLSMGAQAELAQMTPPQQQAYLQSQALQGRGQPQAQGQDGSSQQPYLSSPTGGQ